MADTISDHSSPCDPDQQLRALRLEIERAEQSLAEGKGIRVAGEAEIDALFAEILRARHEGRPFDSSQFPR